MIKALCLKNIVKVDKTKIVKMAKNDAPSVENKTFEFPGREFYNSSYYTSFNGKKYDNPYEGLSKEEIANLRKARKEQAKLEKQARLEEKARKLEENKPICTIDEDAKTIDIIAKGQYPANILSNFKREEVPFYVDGVPCHSLEGFLQALKTPDTEIQLELCAKSGAAARRLGRILTKKAKWKDTQTLYWQGPAYPRESEKYHDLIKKAYNSRFEASEDYRNALASTKGYSLTHKCGKQDPKETILTEKEFVEMLEFLRAKL